MCNVEILGGVTTMQKGVITYLLTFSCDQKEEVLSFANNNSLGSTLSRSHTTCALNVEKRHLHRHKG